MSLVKNEIIMTKSNDCFVILAADWMSWGLGKGAEKAGHYIKLGSDKLKAKINPEEKPREVDPRLQTGVRYARQGAHVAVKVSSFLGSFGYYKFAFLLIFYLF